MGPKFKPFLAGLLGLLFAATLLSQSVMDGLSILLCLVLLIAYFRTRKSGQKFELFPKMNLEKIWIAWFIVVAIGFVLNWTPGSNWLVRLIEFKWIILLYFMLAAYGLVQWRAETVMRFLSVTLLLCSALGLFLFWYHSQERLESLLNPMTYAHMYGPCFCLLLVLGALGWRSYLNSSKDRALWMVAVLLTGLSVLLTFTRGVWFGCAVGIVAAGFVLNWVLGLSVLVAGAASAVAMFFTWSTFQIRVLQAFGMHHSYDGERVVLWKTNWYIFTQHPIFGLGYGESSRRLREFYDILGVPKGQFESHAHNQYLHLLAGTGVLGVGIYLFLAGFFLYYSFLLYKNLRAPFEKAVALGCLSGLICFYASGFTESNFEHAKVRMIVMFLWAAVLYLRAQLQNLPVRFAVS